MSSTRELNHALEWLDFALKAELEPDKAIRDTDYCINRAIEFADNSVIIPVYTFHRASNQPYPQSKGYFVLCSKRDMQPYQCDSVLVDNLAEAYEAAFYNAEKWGESHALINGESFEF